MSVRVLCHVVVASVFLVAIGIAAAPRATRAQDTSATPAMQMQTEGHPVHIHSGTCATLGGIDFPLNNLTAPGMMATPVTGAEASPEAGLMASPAAGVEPTLVAGEEMGNVESQSTTQVEASLDDILSVQRAINAHESVEQIDLYIACGDLVAKARGGKLVIDLLEQNNSGLVGRAMLTDNGDGTTTVDVVLIRKPTGTPVATPAS
jgi:hypothetical protein